MNKYILSAIGGMLCTLCEAVIMHGIEVFLPGFYQKILDFFRELAYKIFSRNISDFTLLTILIVVSFIGWGCGIYLLIRGDKEW